jgi:hypothetical protein
MALSLKTLSPMTLSLMILPIDTRRNIITLKIMTISPMTFSRMTNRIFLLSTMVLSIVA